MSEQISEKLVRILDWRRNDIEQKLGFAGGKYTDVNNLLAFGFAILITIIFFGAMIGTGEATHRASFILLCFLVFGR